MLEMSKKNNKTIWEMKLANELENIPEEIEKYIDENQIPTLEFQPIEDDYTEAYSNFYLTKVL